ncbi:MAG: 2-hydroxychromene-2-carboxylate isomerase [Rhodocyclales bacterium]|jgi:2-hydroxychromene-2-carboxylate isomerase|nr:2-hydroxychromene-2-carboxylate isomerase [Rhodocyclales bacterium]
MAKYIDFWFDFASTYSYLAALRIEPLATTRNVKVNWRPFLLGPVFTAMGWNDSPFNIYPSKGRYMWRDMERLCQHYRLPLKKPSKFPRNGLRPARIICANHDAVWIPDFVRAVFTAGFAADQDIGEREVVAGLLGTLGLDAEALIADAEGPEGKHLLRRQTEEAFKLDIFGAPTFIVNGEIFWGNDRLQQALAWADGIRD